MTTQNMYAELSEFLALPDMESAQPRDDVFVERLLERCSREFDGDTGYWFYADHQTRRFDVPKGPCLELDAPLLSVVHLTNGDGTNIEDTEYDLTPFNGPHHNAVELHPDSTVTWQPMAGSARTRGVIYVEGHWGFMDRNSTDPESMRAILNSKSAILTLALAVYKRRYGVGAEGVAQVTGAGVVITPRDKSPEYLSIVQRYRNLL